MDLLFFACVFRGSVVKLWGEIAGRRHGNVRKVRASQGKGAGQLPVKATSRKVQQKNTVKCGPQAPVR